MGRKMIPGRARKFSRMVELGQTSREFFGPDADGKAEWESFKAWQAKIPAPPPAPPPPAPVPATTATPAPIPATPEPPPPLKISPDLSWLFEGWWKLTDEQRAFWLDGWEMARGRKASNQQVQMWRTLAKAMDKRFADKGTTEQLTPDDYVAAMAKFMAGDDKILTYEENQCQKLVNSQNGSKADAIEK